MIGVDVQTLTAPPSGGAPASTGSLFLCCAPGAGTSIELCRSIADFETAFGVRTTANASSWDYVDSHLREGGSQVYVAPYTGSAYTTALAMLDPRLGPGQLAVIGATPSATLYEDMATAAQTCNLVALGDLSSTDNTETLAAAKAAFYPTDLPDYIGIFGSWVNVPGPVGYTAVGPRQVPASAIIAALCNRVDKLGNPNRAAAGNKFPLQYAQSFIYDPIQADRDTLIAAGVNMFADRWGVLQNYGFRTGMPKSETSPFWQLNCSRTRMAIKFDAQLIGENYMFAPIDAEGHTASALGSDLEAMLLGYYDVDALFGDTPADAFAVNISTAINTTASAADAVLNASVQLKLAQAVETVEIDLVSIPVTGVIVS